MVKSLPCSALGAGFIPAQGTMRFPGGSDSKASEQRGGPGFDPWVGKIPWKRKWQLTPVLLSGKSHGRRSLAGYSPWGRKESDTTEWLHFLSFFQGTKIPHATEQLSLCTLESTCHNWRVRGSHWKILQPNKFFFFLSNTVFVILSWYSCIFKYSHQLNTWVASLLTLRGHAPFSLVCKGQERREPTWSSSDAQLPKALKSVQLHPLAEEGPKPGDWEVEWNRADLSRGFLKFEGFLRKSSGPDWWGDHCHVKVHGL